MTGSSGNAVVKWVNNVSGLVCLILENGDTCLLHKTKLNLSNYCNRRKLKRGYEVSVSSLDDTEWALI